MSFSNPDPSDHHTRFPLFSKILCNSYSYFEGNGIVLDYWFRKSARESSEVLWHYKIACLNGDNDWGWRVYEPRELTPITPFELPTFEEAITHPSRDVREHAKMFDFRRRKYRIAFSLRKTIQTI